MTKRKACSCRIALCAALAHAASPKTSTATPARVCGATYSPSELVDPVSILSGSTPIKRESEHYFFKLSEYEERIARWMQDAKLDKKRAG